MTAPVAVLGAAGKTGRAVTAALLERGQPLRALVRRAGAVAAHPLVTEHVADLADERAVASALDGVRAAYLIAPNVHPDEPGLLAPVLRRCSTAGVRVVYHSVLRPWAPAMPHHRDKGRVETALHDSDLDWTVLQPASYQDNAAVVGEQVLRHRRWPLPYCAAAPFTPVALADVAAVAARVLTEDGHSAATYELAGPERLSTADLAAVAGELLGHRVEVVVDRRAWRAGAGAALTTDARRRLEAMFDHYNRHGLVGNPTVLALLLGRIPTTWQQWVRQHWLR